MKRSSQLYISVSLKSTYSVSSLLADIHTDAILPKAHKLLGKKEPRNVTAIVLPYGGETLVNEAVRF